MALGRGEAKETAPAQANGARTPSLRDWLPHTVKPFRVTCVLFQKPAA
jgi:hypothetical protein